MKKIGLLPRIFLAIALGILFGQFAPEGGVRLFATFNGMFGNFLSFAIPLIIIGFIAPGIGQLGLGAGRLLGVTTVFAYGSTILAGLLAYGASQQVLPAILAGKSFGSSFDNPEEALAKAFFTVDIPPVMSVMTALVLAFVIGLGMAAIPQSSLQKVMDEVQTIVEKLIANIIIPLLPLHIFGIFANMTFAGQVATIMSVFAKVFVMVIALHLLVLVVQYIVSGTMMRRNPFVMLKTMMPAYFTAIGTQSSASTIPVTLRQTKSLGVKDRIADFCIPLLATIHLSGSTITLVTCSMAVMMLNDMTVSFGQLFPFILMLGVTMIAAPGVPGGAVMAALGLLETMLGFDKTMLSLMIALYLAQDSFGTACNVTGDAAITGMVNAVSGKEETA